MPLFNFQQNIFLANQTSQISGQSCLEAEVTKYLPKFLLSVDEGAGIGLAPVYGPGCKLKQLAISSLSQVLVVTVGSKSKKKTKNTKNKTSELQDLLCRPELTKYAFEMDKLATSLFSDCGVHIVAAKDLLSVSTNDRQSQEARLCALGGRSILVKAAVEQCFLHEETALNDLKTAALQAWAALNSASLPSMRSKIEKVPSINTLKLDQQVLEFASKAIRDASRLDALKPTRTQNDVDKKGILQTGGNFAVNSERFKTRVMQNSSSQTLKIKTTTPGGGIKVSIGRTTEVAGPVVTVKLLSGDKPTTVIKSVETIGKDLPNSAEAFRSWILLNALQGIFDFSNHFISHIWFGKTMPSIPSDKRGSAAPFYSPSERSLNTSQMKAVRAILSIEDNRQMVLIHGPPGTGKTTVIAAAVTSVMASPDTSKTVWLVAQSNVAVKNIAEKLWSVGYSNFKIIVSKDFHFGWHEHLYTDIERNLIRSDDLTSSPVAMSRLLLDSRVVLCTMSMLSNEKLATISRIVPLQTVIIDEASQIEIGGYLPLLVKFRPTLRKLVFIGDDKQLAPYGSSDVPDLESIFEKQHLRKADIFLDTQYRMPVPIGSFISKHVYKNKLKSSHEIKDSQCCRFIDVNDGAEASHGHSWKNDKEVDAAIRIAEQLQHARQPFRIITPYDPQRNLLEQGLKNAKLDWRDKCFNIDSFQGNEDDYIVISLVRSAKLGFLRELRRTNVMLSRCKKGMVICTSRKFIEGPAANSLVGKLAQSLPDTAWLDVKQIRAGVRPFPDSLAYGPGQDGRDI